MYVRMDGWMDGWINECMYACIYLCVLVHTYTYALINCTTQFYFDAALHALSQHIFCLKTDPFCSQNFHNFSLSTLECDHVVPVICT